MIWSGLSGGVTKHDCWSVSPIGVWASEATLTSAQIEPMPDDTNSKRLGDTCSLARCPGADPDVDTIGGNTPASMNASTLVWNSVTVVGTRANWMFRPVSVPGPAVRW